MPFETVKTVSGSERKIRASVSYKKISTKKGGGLPRLVVGIPAIIADEITVRAGQRFVFQLGTGDDAGTARVAPAPNGDGIAPREVRGGLTFLFGVAPELGDDEEAKQFCKVEAVDGGFQIEVPEWLRQYG